MAALLALSFPIAVCPNQGVRITCVHDGDTFIVDRERIRLMDIDTPEMEGQCASESRLAVRARDQLVAILNSEQFVVHRDGQDRYGRTLAVVTNSRGSVGDQLVREGLARTWSGRREPWC
ncbi:thermonuclease family protein [Erythrobacter arachoides]|uniref:Thermonuclease family protein n=1 Tax=Aurantiacibacter arachoides TaxID=1850444 RepID=A0A845A1H1_9SPHN|nr:thermonuclease family protein [Aurantiacibacter arachoides]MXO94391.1 thermonuclease family protein [Aurantiacibacter arachoides]